MVADDLLGRRLALIEPACELLVELCAQRLRYCVVGGVTDEDVAEAEDVLLSSGALGHEQLLADERHQRCGERRLELRRRQSGHGRPRELAADHRRAFDDGTLDRAQLIQTSGQQGLDRRRDRVGGHIVALLREHRRHLLEKERVPFRCFRDPRPSLWRRAKLAEQRFGFFGSQRVEDQGIRVRARVDPTGAKLEEIGAGDADEEERSAGPTEQVLDHIEEGRSGPVDVLNEDDDRPPVGECLEQAPQRPRRLICGDRAG